MAVEVPVEFTAEVRTLVIDRDLSRCALCARPLHGGAHLHHRKLRSRGGRGNPANGITLCGRCHEKVHRSPGLATRDGYQVASWDDPAEVPVRTWRGWVLLDDAGTWESAQNPSGPS